MYWTDRRNFFGDGTDDFGDKNDKRSLESPMSVFIQFPTIPDHSECIWQVFEECITDQQKNRRTDRRTDERTHEQTKPHIEMQGRI